MKHIIKKLLREGLVNKVDFDSFPKNILKTLKDEYGQYYQNKFDWNSKQDEFVKDGVFDGKGFNEWLKNNEREEFIKNLDVLIKKTRQDLILKQRKRLAQKVLDDFEDLVIPVLGDEVLIGPISKYLESALLIIGSVNTDIDYINKELAKAHNEAKNIIDAEGSLDYSKITPSSLFSGDKISLPKFKDFVKKNPEYKGVFNHWEKLFDKTMEISLMDLNAYRSSTPYSEIRDLYNFLIKFKRVA
jgi:hypothetical protein